MCRGENAPNPDAGSSQDGGATPPPSPPRPQSQSPVSLSARSSASTTDEEEARERERRKNKFYYENYSEYQISPDMWGENGDNSGDSAGKRLGHKEKVREEEQRKERMDYENYDDYKIYWDHNIGDLFLGHELSQISLDLLSDNGDNRSDSAREMGDKELLTALFPDFDRGYDIFWQKITLLSEKYEFFRRAARDGNCFYRAFIFSYLEHVLEIQDDAERRSEVKHLGQCIEKAKEAYGSLGSALMFDAQLSPFDGFEYVVDLIQSGLSAGQLYLVDKTDKIISSILPSLRLLIEIELYTQEDFYNPFISYGEYGSVREFCQYEVRRVNSETNHWQIIALVNALGVPLILENLDTTLDHGVVQLNQLAFCPRPEPKVNQMSASLKLHESLSSMELLDQPSTSVSGTNSSMEALILQSIGTGSSSTSSEGDSGEDAGERTIADLSPAERRRLVTLLYRPGHYDILYPK